MNSGCVTYDMRGHVGIRSSRWPHSSSADAERWGGVKSKPVMLARRAAAASGSWSLCVWSYGGRYRAGLSELPGVSRTFPAWC